MPSQPSGCTPCSLTFSSTLSASDLTWRLEVPLAITMKSVTLVLPRTSMTVMSLGLHVFQGGNRHLDQLFGLHCQTLHS